MEGENERTDVCLCFQALGIDFGAPPEEVEKAYHRMVAEIKKNQASPDPAVRAGAFNDLELAYDIYEKIRNSVTYKTRMREFEQAEASRKEAKKKTIQQFKICLSCKKTIGATLKKCPYCREPVRTPLEAFIIRFYSGKTLAVMIILLVLISGGILFTSMPDLFKKPREQPVVESTASDSFRNLSGASGKI